MQRSVWECVSKKVCVCECVIPSSTHYSRTYPRVAFTSDLCSTAGTITERPDSSANVHHIHSLSSSPSFLTTSFLHIRLTRGANLKQEKKENYSQFDMSFNKVKLYLFMTALFFFFALAFLSTNHSCFYVFSFMFLILSLVHFFFITRERWSERTWDGKRGDKDRVRREAWLGAVTGQLPVPLPAFFSPSSPPPPPLSVHPQATELPSGEEGGWRD